MSDPISSVPLVSLLGAMDAADLLAHSPVPQSSRAPQEQVPALAQEVELTLSAAALLGSTQASSSLAQLAGNAGPQLATQLLSSMGSYPIPTPAGSRAASLLETLGSMPRTRMLLNAPESEAAQPQAARSSTEVIVSSQVQYLAQPGVVAEEPQPTILSPLTLAPEKLAAATAQSLYLTYAEPIEQLPTNGLTKRLILGTLLLLLLAAALYLVR